MPNLPETPPNFQFAGNSGNVAAAPHPARTPGGPASPARMGFASASSGGESAGLGPRAGDDGEAEGSHLPNPAGLPLRLVPLPAPSLALIDLLAQKERAEREIEELTGIRAMPLDERTLTPRRPGLAERLHTQQITLERLTRRVHGAYERPVIPYAAVGEAMRKHLEDEAEARAEDRYRFGAPSFEPIADRRQWGWLDTVRALAAMRPRWRVPAGTWRITVTTFTRDSSGERATDGGAMRPLRHRLAALVLALGDVLVATVTDDAGARAPVRS